MTPAYAGAPTSWSGRHWLQNRPDNLRRQSLYFLLQPGLGFCYFFFQNGTGFFYHLLRAGAGFVQSSLTAFSELLPSRFLHFKDGHSCLTQALLVLRSFGCCGRDIRLRLGYGSLGAFITLFQNFLQRFVYQGLVGQEQKKNKDNGRNSSDEKSFERLNKCLFH